MRLQAPSRRPAGVLYAIGAPRLVVHDVAANRRVVRRVLEPLGFELLDASDGAEALVTYEVERPDLVLLDLPMPGMSGDEVLARRRARHGGKPRVLVVSGHADEERVARLREAGAGFLGKPFRAQQLAQAVRGALRPEAAPAPIG